jgi:LysM repeat protein
LEGIELTEHFAPAPRPRSRIARFLAPAALAALVAAVVLIVTHPPGTGGTQPNAVKGRHTTVRRLPPYWTVHPGDTLTEISVKTGLSINQLEAYNPNTDPTNLVPGQRLLLWRHPPAPRPKPPGPLFWTVKPGESFGSIAAKTGISIVTLEQLNPHLKPATLQPGNRVRLRH